MFDEDRARVVEVLEEDAGVGGRAAAGCVGCEGADGFEGGLLREVVGVLDEQQDAADGMQRSNGTAGDDGELRGEGGDRDEAEVGGAFVELLCAGGGKGVANVVAGAKVCGCGFVLEVVEQRRGVQKRDGGDAEGHRGRDSGIGNGE